MTDTTATMAALEAYLDATEGRPARVLQGVPADPEHLGASRSTPPTAARPPSGWPTP